MILVATHVALQGHKIILAHSLRFFRFVSHLDVQLLSSTRQRGRPVRIEAKLQQPQKEFGF
jgi:hypothetical protein